MAPPIGLPFRNHWLPDALDEVSVTLPPEQNVVGPPGVIVGVAGGMQIDAKQIATSFTVGVTAVSAVSRKISYFR